MLPVCSMIDTVALLVDDAVLAVTASSVEGCKLQAVINSMSGSGAMVLVGRSL